MRARESHYQELRELKAFFRAWCGYRWNRWVEPEARLYRGEISKVLGRRASFNRTLLPRLRLVRTRMMERAGLQEPCAPSKKSARASTVTPDSRSLESPGRNW